MSLMSYLKTIKIPYLMLFGCYFLIGFGFVVIIGYLLFVSMGNISVTVVWNNIAQQSVSQDIVFFLLTIISGFMVNAFSQMLAFLVCSATQCICRWLFKSNISFFIGGASFFNKKYARCSVWLSKNRNEKSQWEWEFFNYYFYWGMTFNTLTFVLVNWTLSGSPNWFALLILFFLGSYSLMRSKGLLNFYNYCIKASKQ